MYASPYEFNLYSPPSSPSASAIDSSPPMTPDLSSTSSLGSCIDHGPALIHPFAASAKTDRKFKLHEFLPRNPAFEMEQQAFIIEKAVARPLRRFKPRDDDFEFAEGERVNSELARSQEAIWDAAIHDIFDGKSRCIDLACVLIIYLRVARLMSS